MKKKIFSVLKLLFFLGLGVLFIWLFLKDLGASERAEIFASFRRANYTWVVITIIIAITSHVIRTLRWQMLMKPMGYDTRFKNVFMALMIGYLANLALPRLGEISRCSVVAKYEKVPFQKGLGTVVAERAFDLLCYIILFFANLYLQYELIHQYVSENILQPLSAKLSAAGQAYLLYGLIGGGLLILVLLIIFRKKLERFKLYQKIKGIIKGFIDGLRSLLQIKKPGLFLLYTLLIWIMYFLMTYLCFFALKEMGGLSLLSAFSVLVLGTIGIMVVQGGIGIYPAIVAETLVLYGAASTSAYALGWLIWSAQTAALVLAGLVSLILLPLLNKNQDEKYRKNTEQNPIAG